MDTHDHSSSSHTAKCDKCTYVAEIHAHDDDEGSLMLSRDLASHNKEVHNEDTDPESIKDAVRAKMQSL